MNILKSMGKPSNEQELFVWILHAQLTVYLNHSCTH